MRARGEIGVRERLLALYADALTEPELALRVTRAYREYAPARQVLDGSLDSLWRSVLTADAESSLDPSEAPAISSGLDDSQKTWLLLIAGLLRGFNLSIITSWRKSGDDLAALGTLYPGFFAYSETFFLQARRELESPAVRALDLAGKPLDEKRAFERIAENARAIIRLGLERGYGLGFLIDSALWPKAKREPSELIGAALGDAREDDLSQVMIAGWLFETLDPPSRQEARYLLSGITDWQLLDRVLADESRERPLAVPESIGRFSVEYFETMLAYLYFWWLEVGLRMGLAERQGRISLDPRGVVWERLRVRNAVVMAARGWASEDSAQTFRLTANPMALRYSLAGRAKDMAAIGWRLARDIFGV